MRVLREAGSHQLRECDSGYEVTHLDHDGFPIWGDVYQDKVEAVDVFNEVIDNE